MRSRRTPPRHPPPRRPHGPHSRRRSGRRAQRPHRPRLPGLTVEYVADHSGVHKTTLYRRWGGLEGMVADALDMAGEDTWTPPDTGSLEGDLRELAREVVDSFSDEAAASAPTAMSRRRSSRSGPPTPCTPSTPSGSGAARRSWRAPWPAAKLRPDTDAAAARPRRFGPAAASASSSPANRSTRRWPTSRRRQPSQRPAAGRVRSEVTHGNRQPATQPLNH